MQAKVNLSSKPVLKSDGQGSKPGLSDLKAGLNKLASSGSTGGSTYAAFGQSTGSGRSFDPYGDLKSGKNTVPEINSVKDVVNYIVENAQPGSVANAQAKVDLENFISDVKDNVSSKFDLTVDKVEKSLGDAIVHVLNGEPTPGINSGKDAGKAGSDYSYNPVVSVDPGNSIGGDITYASAGGASDLGYQDIISAIRDTSAANTAASQAMAERQMSWQEEQNAKAMEFNSAEAQKNRDWQEYMSNSAHQREVADMMAAGINPVLSITGGNGATVTSGATASGVTSAGSRGDVDTSLSGALSSIFNNLINAKTSQNIAQINANSAQTVAGINAGASAYAANASADAVRYSANMNSVSRALGSVLGLFK